MKINIPKVIVPVDMSEYAPELAGQCLHVWVNPPLDVLGAHLALAAEVRNAPVSAETMQDPLLEWYVGVWSHGPEPTHWTIAEVKEVERDDPAFLSWMISATWNARKAHMDRKKKN
jgi:hypothetical protein